jgi:gliding motility-associated lipoprotein GldD
VSKIIITYGFLFFLSLTQYGCQEIAVPKPKAFLALDYTAPTYQTTAPNLPLTFDKNELSKVNLVQNNNEILGIDLKYNPLNAAVHISYKNVQNNLKALIQSSLSITQQHAKIAHSISEKEFRNDSNRVYGKIFDLSGPVASQIQFYVTDSTHHFLSGALYFNKKPNYDSIYPAIRYIQKDIVRMMESMKWEN